MSAAPACILCLCFNHMLTAFLKTNIHHQMNYSSSVSDDLLIDAKFLISCFDSGDIIVPVFCLVLGSLHRLHLRVHLQ
jgi:hypothetical protein